MTSENVALKCEKRKEMKYKVIGLNSHSELNCFTTKRDAIEWVDDVLLDVKNFNLIGALNDIQAACNIHATLDVQTVNCFPDKFDMPLLLINLILKDHGIRIDK